MYEVALDARSLLAVAQRRDCAIERLGRGGEQGDHRPAAPERALPADEGGQALVRRRRQGSEGTRVEEHSGAPLGDRRDVVVDGAPTLAHDAAAELLVATPNP